MYNRFIKAQVLLPAVLAIMSLPAVAAGAGELLYVRGNTSVEGAQGMRLVGPGSTLFDGDVITTADDSFALIKLIDGSRVTLRPDTRFEVQEVNPNRERVRLRLVRGGIRARTGDIALRNPTAFTLSSGSQTLHAQNADFIARACTTDCAEEGQSMQQVQSPLTDVVGRALIVNGEVTISRADSAAIRLNRGAPITVGDTINTARRAFTVLVFRDDTRVTLQPDSEFNVQAYLLDPSAPEAETGSFRLRNGGMRAKTGGLAQRRLNSLRFATPLAVIGIRGTGFDSVEADECAGQTAPGGGPGLATYVWEGAVVLEESNALINAGQTLCLLELGGTPIPLPDPPVLQTPRPDEVEVPQNFFGSVNQAGTEPGLQVSVSDGLVVLAGAGDDLFLGPGEDGISTGSSVLRVQNTQAIGRADPFLRLDTGASVDAWERFEPDIGSMCLAP